MDCEIYSEALPFDPRHLTIFPRYQNLCILMETDRQNKNTPATDSFGELVFDETLRRNLRKTPQQRLDTLCASLRDAEARGLIPKRDRAAHERKLLWLIQHASSKP